MLSAKEARYEASNNNQTKEMLKKIAEEIKKAVGRGEYSTRVDFSGDENPTEGEMHAVLNILESNGYFTEFESEQTLFLDWS